MKTTMKIVLPAMAALALTAGMAPSALAASDVITGSKTVTISVPPRMTLAVDTTAVSLTADPADTDASNATTAGGAATVTVKTNYPTALYLKVSASTPTSGSDTIGVSNFKFKHDSTTAGGSTVNVTQGASWTAFSNSAASIATLTGRTSDTKLKYDYAVDRDWAYASGTYSSTVTYTLATN
jgi:hypothetical protein